MKKTFFFGVLAGCIFSVLILAGYYFGTKYASKKSIVSTEVQQQIIRNIQDTNKILTFADDNLSEYTDNLMEIREILVKSKNEKYLNEEEKQKITSLSKKSIQIIETAMFNTLPVFFNNSNGEYNRVIPVTLDATTPSYKINISCIKFNKDVINEFIKNLPPEKGLENSIAELDKILSAVALERAQLGAYKTRLAYSLETAEALSKNNFDERQTEINKIIQKIKTEELVLSVQSANGIYCSEDRQQIQLNFNELNKELNRINALSKKSTTYNKNISLLSQSDAENAMLYLVKDGHKYF